MLPYVLRLSASDKRWCLWGILDHTAGPARSASIKPISDVCTRPAAILPIFMLPCASGAWFTAGEPSIASSRLSERNEGWGTSLSKRGLRKPGGYPHQIESGRNEQMKKSCLGQANVARASQIPDPNAL